ncbi:MAG: hypothetical protein QFX33_02995 [Candidatus Nezhaarchaeota archaeon]|nr:hypothetical protein [Candidatus Nezhaarchaeota archaeon]
MSGKYRLYVSTCLTALLVLAIIAGTVNPPVAKAELQIWTDKALYVMQWMEKDGSYVPQGFVTVIVSYSGLDPSKIYRVEIRKIAPTATEPLTYLGTISGAASGDVIFIVPPTKDAKPETITGTWRAYLYDAVGNLLKNCTFGIWAISAPEINYGRVLKIWGGGASPNSIVEIEVDTITNDLFGGSPVRCKADANGLFSNVSKPIPSTVPEGEYTVKITSYIQMDQPGKPIEDQEKFKVTKELIVNIISPEDGSKWKRTETIPIEVEVLYKDYTPMTAGQVNVTITAADGESLEVPLTFYATSATWRGGYKTYPCNATGTWNFYADALDFYGNSGEDQVDVTVEKAVLVVEQLIQPESVVPRASWVTWRIKVTYAGDDSLVELDIPACKVYVVNATTGAIFASASSISKISKGIYNVTWYVPADAPMGAYKFLIKANDLEDACDNTGPASNVYSDQFKVGVTSLIVNAETYSEKSPTAIKKAFVPGSTVYIGAKVTYATSGVIMSAGTVKAKISNSTWSTTVDMVFDPATRMWWCSLTTTGMTSGKYDVTVNARDLGDNVGSDTTYFFLAGFILTPAKGTVPPESMVTASNLTKAQDVYLVTAGIYTEPVSGKSLGTTVTVTGTQFTPNSKVNVTISGLPYLTGKTVLVLINVPTDSEGTFTGSFVFPTAPSGTYTITATDAKGVSRTAQFTVIPGLILTPGEIVGSGIINVIGTGYPANEEAQLLLADGTDALTPLTYYVSSWTTNANGTIVSYPVALSDSVTVKVKPAFVLPLVEPKTYTISLYIGCKAANDTVIVVNDLKEIGRIVSGVGELKALMGNAATTLVNIEGDLAILKANTGYVKARVDDLVAALSSLNAVVTEVKGDVATIKTDAGTIKTNVGNLATMLSSLNAVVTEVKGDVATIKTDAGTIKTNVGNLASLLNTVSSNVDSAASAVAGLPMLIWVAIVLSLIAAVAAIVAVLQVSKVSKKVTS